MTYNDICNITKFDKLTFKYIFRKGSLIAFSILDSTNFFKLLARTLTLHFLKRYNISSCFSRSKILVAEMKYFMFYNRKNIFKATVVLKFHIKTYLSLPICS